MKGKKYQKNDAHLSNEIRSGIIMREEEESKEQC
jgi:hypothetical protein